LTTVALVDSDAVLLLRHGAGGPAGWSHFPSTLLLFRCTVVEFNTAMARVETEKHGGVREVLVLLRCCMCGGDARSGAFRSGSWWREETVVMVRERSNNGEDGGEALLIYSSHIATISIDDE